MNEPMTDQEIRDIEKLAEAATPGPWAVDKMGRYEDHDECEIELPDDDIELCRYENADFIAASRTAVPRMAGEIRRLREALKWMRFAYINKDADMPHQFEIEALQEVEKLIGPCAENGGMQNE